MLIVVEIEVAVGESHSALADVKQVRIAILHVGHGINRHESRYAHALEASKVNDEFGQIVDGFDDFVVLPYGFKTFLVESS